MHLKTYCKHRKSERDKGIKLVLKIFSNILNNLSEIGKYGNLNYNKINKKLSMCKPALQLLFIAGFNQYICDDKRRLIWRNTTENMREMRNIYNVLNMHEEEINTFISLINEGFTNEEAMNAINISNNKK